jgi:mRNA-degrading endonuclease toxin of MazEF toxin-antitoxin module
MPSTTIYERGHIGQRASKPRPAVVVSAEHFHELLLCPISSQPRYYKKPGPGDHPLAHWKTLGLRYPSTARVSNLLAVEKKLIKRVLGTLHGDDLARVEHGLREAFGLQRLEPSPSLWA